MDTEHILSLTTDYALGLLTAEERRRVERHAGRCPTCRAALARERSLAALVRGAVQQATWPDPARLGALRPAAARPRPAVAPLYRRLAPVTLATVLLALGLLFGRGAPSFAPAVFAGGTPTQTATQTHTPTATWPASGSTTAPTIIAAHTAAPQPATTPQP
ncbi:MAG: zf-HC2 domain-containing protein [Anaerolineae bacterium]|uniref:anti-sigma factor family protein n=1 Tax=Promineifilum sp. TaxID=2664178 RepID=UPI001D44B612|nr:zf-HC2 domain-containing protein [Anaerolineales bacterium]MCO5179286.1 zf-HC2 domain-containing protein [Promineifilum sp.]MCW5847679.1 zf-HC2 domain-containing protein [Anaerolineae bacterium]